VVQVSSLKHSLQSIKKWYGKMLKTHKIPPQQRDHGSFFSDHLKMAKPMLILHVVTCKTKHASHKRVPKQNVAGVVIRMVFLTWFRNRIMPPLNQRDHTVVTT
jgi:hypothetical protein